MISILILVGLCLTADAHPVVGSYVVDGVQGVLYEVPEYEDPELALLQLTAMGVMPVLTVLQEAELLDGEDATCMEEFSDVKKGLDGIIVGLEAARSKFEEGSTDIENDIGKSITHLMRLKHHIQSHINHASPVDPESSTSNTGGQDQIPQVEKHSTQGLTTTGSSGVNGSNDDIARIMTVADAIMVSEPGEKSVNSFLKFKQPLHKLNDPLASYDQELSEIIDGYDEELSETHDDMDSLLESEKVTQSATSSEKSDKEDSKHELVELKTVGEGLVISEKNKDKDVGKALFRKKWSWTPSKDE